MGQILREGEKLLVSEIFFSLQGEGPKIGEPSIFIRLAGCIEPYCPWCDTAYARYEYSEKSIPDIVHEAGRYACKNVVITGGEPFLQWESGLKKLHEKLSEKELHISYETSGKAGIPDLHGAQVVVSPKNIDGNWQIPQEALSKADFFKFVADDIASLVEIHDFVQKNAISKEKVYIMPMGMSREEQIQRMELVFGFCRDKGYKMSPRLHILAFDKRPGV
jgi:7-carboxy-7-deazaguanine synthase